MKHTLTYTEGTDARNHVARCSCGWAYGSTYNDCRSKGFSHVDNNSRLYWNDPRRQFESKP